MPDGVQPGHGKGSDSPGAGLDRGLPLAGHAVSFGLQGVQISGRPCHLDLRRLVGTLQLCQLLFLCCNLQAMRSGVACETATFCSECDGRIGVS
jgi:hypothetical protein